MRLAQKNFIGICKTNRLSDKNKMGLLNRARVSGRASGLCLAHHGRKPTQQVRAEQACFAEPQGGKRRF